MDIDSMTADQLALACAGAKNPDGSYVLCDAVRVECDHLREHEGTAPPSPPYRAHITSTILASQRISLRLLLTSPRTMTN